MTEESSASKISKSSIYPEATRHLPGNAAGANLPTLTGLQPEIIAGADKKVHYRVQSLRFYSRFTLAYGIFTVLIYTIGRQSLNDGGFLVIIPGPLQHVGLAAACLPIISAPVFLLHKHLQPVKAALLLQLLGFAAVFVTSFGLIVTDFTNFFFGVGLVAVAQVFLALWTRSVLLDVQGLREAED